MNKERTISGIKVVVSGETYDEYKGTLQEQLEEKDKEIERLNNIIKEVREIFKDYGDKEDIVGYTMYNITGEMLLKLLGILDKGE